MFRKPRGVAELLIVALLRARRQRAGRDDEHRDEYPNG